MSHCDFCDKECCRLDCPSPAGEERRKPRRFRWKIEKHPTGRLVPYRYGCYFPFTDLVIGDMGARGTWCPKDVEWLDQEAPKPKPDWNGISPDDRRLWFGVAEEGMEAPWFSPFGACLVKIWDIRRRADGVIEFGIGNETKPEPSEIGWVTGDKFFDEWPQ